MNTLPTLRACAALLPAILAPLAAQTWQPTLPSGTSVGAVTDTTRGRILVFGGARTSLVTTIQLDETWWYDAQGFRPAMTPGAPAPRGYGLLAHDAARGRTVLFGSVTATGSALTETWEHDGTNWQQVLPATSPASNLGALVYVPFLGGCLLFTGTGETWLYDGTTWIQRTPTASPPARDGFGLAFDPTRQVVVLYGGYAAPAFLADTWEFDGTTWSQANPTASPPADSPQMTFDAARGRVLARLRNVVPSEWEYDGSTWTALPMVVTLPTYFAEQLLPSPSSGRTMLLMRSPGGEPNAFFSELVGTSWIPEDASRIPPARFDARTAVDVRRDQVLLFGGRSTEVPGDRTAECWLRNGQRWYLLDPTPSPPSRYGHGLVHDAARDRMVMFGGSGSQGTLGDTWEFAAGQWTPRTNVGSPGPRYRFGMAYDPLRRRTLLFGGQSGGLLASLWRYDGVSWTAIPTPSGPTARADVAMAYDAANDRMVVFGGETAFGDSGETWAWTPLGWQLISSTGPLPRQRAAMQYDPLCGCVVLHGGRTGNTVYGDTWELRGNTWTQAASASTMLDRFGADMLALPHRGRLEVQRGAALFQLFSTFIPIALRDQWQRTPDPVAQAVRHGTGCAGSAGTPSLAPSGGSVPALGSTFTLQVQNVPSNPGLAAFALGTDITLSGGAPLPQDLAVIGLPGCALWIAPELLVAVATGSGTASLALALPSTPTLAGSVLGIQVLALDAAGPGFGGAVSNAVVDIVH